MPEVFSCEVLKVTRPFLCTGYHCAVPENIHTPPTEGIGISSGWSGSVRPNNFKKCVTLNWNFQRGLGGML